MFFSHILSMWYSNFGRKLPHALVQFGTNCVGKRTWASSGQQETGARKGQERPNTAIVYVQQVKESDYSPLSVTCVATSGTLLKLYLGIFTLF